MSTTESNAKVSPERWQQAQEWEEQFWRKTEKARTRFGKGTLWSLLAKLHVVSPYQGDDWNAWWKEKFDGYGFLPREVQNAVELGCGPYSNMRLILDSCKPRHLFLSDPLVKTYVTFKNGFVAQMYRSGFVCIDDHAIEQCPYADNYFDLTVMLNVLDHVQDAERCVERAMAITKKGGFLVIGQDLSNDADINAMKGTEGEVGHPIKIDHSLLEQLLGSQFDPVIHRILDRAQGRAPAHHYGTFIFAAKKR